MQLEAFPELFAVMPAADMADYIGVHRTTVYRAIDDGRLAALQIGRVWLVSKRSAEALFWKDGTRLKKHTRTSSNVRKSRVG